MAIRNSEAIYRQGEMLFRKQKLERQLKEQDFWHRINLIKSTKNDAIDAVDTIDALFSNGLGEKYRQWEKQQKVRYSSQFSKFTCDGVFEETQVCYRPKEDDITFGWSGHGMAEFYRTNDFDAEYFIGRRLDDKGYDGKLSRLASNLQPFLDAFFKWVETI